MKNVTLTKVWVWVRSATTSNWVCVRTLIWTCEVRACDQKNGRNSHLGLIQYGLVCSTNFRLKRVIHYHKIMHKCQNIFYGSFYQSGHKRGKKGTYTYFEVEPNFVKLHCTISFIILASMWSIIDLRPSWYLPRLGFEVLNHTINLQVHMYYVFGRYQGMLVTFFPSVSRS